MLCTADSGILNTTLSREYAIAAYVSRRTGVGCQSVVCLGWAPASRPLATGVPCFLVSTGAAGHKQHSPPSWRARWPAAPAPAQAFGLTNAQLLRLAMEALNCSFLVRRPRPRLRQQMPLHRELSLPVAAAPQAGLMWRNSVLNLCAPASRRTSRRPPAPRLACSPTPRRRLGPVWFLPTRAPRCPPPPSLAGRH